MKKLFITAVFVLGSLLGFSEGKEYASFTYSSVNKIIQMVGPDGSATNFPITNKKVMFADAMSILKKLSVEEGWSVVNCTNAGPGTFYYLLERDAE